MFLFQGCATLMGLKKDSKEAWKTTKHTSGKVYDSTKRAVEEVVE
jgi:hypothetical protein